MIFINNLDPVIWQWGGLAVRWYGLFFALGLGLAYLAMYFLMRREGKKTELLESLFFFLFLGLLVGARLGHVFFYESTYYLAHPVDILKVWNGGLASHGAAIGLFLAYWAWTKVYNMRFGELLDLLALGIPITAFFIRIGNFFNSEIVGLPTGANFGVVFAKLGETFPRHPAQLYEAAVLFFTGLILWTLYLKKGRDLPRFFLIFSFLLMYFGGRFFVEFVKDLHTLPEWFPLSMGQVLSLLPIFLALIYFFKLKFFWREGGKNATEARGEKSKNL